ncbi:hypothetical protein Dsin_025453 [Dipteronia sinensis]|uniref:Pectinesterase inhibitor domain-containing protein n=1 Tax=Dipteronia sinensis TaxID=43782 RepID=A0AAD9ZXD2_9ROSI|nr:hypothetical protein Dsin_025453 [Dipteronia sinensis]
MIKPIMTRLIFLLPLMTLCLQSNAQQASSGVNLIEKVCQQSEKKDLCISSLNSIPDGPKSKDLTGLELVAIKVASEHAQDTWGKINKLLSDSTLEPTVQQNLADCSDQYLDAVEQLDDSIAALLANAYSDVRVWVEAAISDASLCEKATQQLSSKSAEIYTRSNTVVSMLNNILVVNKQLAGK